MPILKSAKKKLRQDKKRTRLNKTYTLAYKQALKKSIKRSGKGKIKDDLKKVYSTLDKAVKANLLHKNKASRLKSKAARFMK